MLVKTWRLEAGSDMVIGTRELVNDTAVNHCWTLPAHASTWSLLRSATVYEYVIPPYLQLSPAAIIVSCLSARWLIGSQRQRAPFRAGH